MFDWILVWQKALVRLDEFFKGEQHQKAVCFVKMPSLQKKMMLFCFNTETLFAVYLEMSSVAGFSGCFISEIKVIKNMKSLRCWLKIFLPLRPLYGDFLLLSVYSSFITSPFIITLFWNKCFPDIVFLLAKFPGKKQGRVEENKKNISLIVDFHKNLWTLGKSNLKDDVSF